LPPTSQSLKCNLRPLLCGIVALALGAAVCLAQHYTFSQAAPGMDNLNVDCIAQDNAGYLWVGTENGLYRYDGSQFRKFGVADGLHRTVQNLYTGSDGTLLVGTTAGIYFKKRDGSFAEIHPSDPLTRLSQRIGTVFTAVAPDQVVTADRNAAYMLRRTDPERWIAEPLHLEDGPIWSVLSGPGGVLWYGCGSDLCRFEGGKTTHMGAALHLPAEQWQHLLLARDGHLWIRGASHLGEVFPAEGRYQAHDLPGHSNAEPYDALVMDREGRIAASQGTAFALWENGHWLMVTAQNGLTNFDISALFADREGSLWIGAVGHGLMRWVGQDRWEALTTAEGLSNNIIWTSLRDRSGRLWVGTESGLDLVPAGASAAKPWKNAGIETPRAVSLAESAEGSIWLGRAAGSLVRIDEKTLAGRAWKTPEIFRTLYDGAHSLWLATVVGLYVVDTATADHTPHLVQDDAFAHPATRFSDLTLDGANHLWAASDRGLYRLDGSGWQRIDPGRSGVNPYLIAADRQGNLWASGNFPGIMRLRISGDKIVESEHIAQPHLLSEQVVSMFVDKRGWLWVGQDAGLTVFDGRIWRSFTQDDGLIWNDLDSNGLAEDTDGSMWIGTSGGLSHLMKPETVPAITPQTPAIPQIAFGATAITNGAQITWNASSLDISLAALSFRDAHHIRLRYRLLGLESDWVETADENIRYPRLFPGDYRFQVEAVDVAGGAASSINEIDFRIIPRWWQSLELRIAMALLAGILVALLWRWRVHLLVRHTHQLELAVQRRTDDLQREKAELERAREQMRHYAEHDDLTGLWNHRIIIERLRGEVDRSRREGVPLSLILVDLDHFKQINDTFGHPSGDSTLKEISAVFQRSVRSYDWVGRYGGEEFLLILPGSNLASARIRAEHLRMAVQVAHIPSDKASIKVTASFGVASGFPSDYESLLHAADMALYRAKDNGRNCVFAIEIDAKANSAGPRG
jgi:diguanylate cyclase (GGDEF)-like protein